MNRQSWRILLIVIAIGTCTFSGKAQHFGEWVSFKLDIDLPRDFSGGLTQEIRTYHPGLQVDQILTDFELGYKINKRFDISVNYRYSRKKEESPYLYPRNRWYLDFKYDNSAGRYGFDYRLRFQRQTTTYIEDAEDELPEYYIRNRIKITFNLPDNKKEPYATFELFHPTYSPEQRVIDAYRITTGVDIPINKKHELDVGLMFEREFLPVYASFINLLLTYSFELN